MYEPFGQSIELSSAPSGAPRAWVTRTVVGLLWLLVLVIVAARIAVGGSLFAFAS